MAPKRRDNKGRILQMGEWQEPNGRYRYIYNDALGKRKIIYSWRLTEADPVPAHKHKEVPLREKEKQVQSLFMQGISGSDLTVIELVERYISLKTGVKQSTLANYKTVINTLNKTEFAFRHVDQVKLSDAKMYLISLQRSGLGYSSIHNIRGVIRPAFQMAVDDDMILKNPFDFEMSSVLINDSNKREALSPQDQKRFLEFVQNDKHYSRYYDAFLFLFSTGLRISDDDDKIRLNQRKPSKYKGLSRFGPEKNLQRINKFMKERPIFYKNLIQMKENFRFYLRCFYCITKVVILQFNSENRTELARNG